MWPPRRPDCEIPGSKLKKRHNDPFHILDGGGDLQPIRGDRSILGRSAPTAECRDHPGRRPWLFRSWLLRRRDPHAKPRWPGREWVTVHAVLQHRAVLAVAGSPAHGVLRTAGAPLANGFDHSYQVEDVGRYFNPHELREDNHKLPPVQPGTGYYSTAAIADHGITYLKEHAEKRGREPFFLYLAYSAPHFPLQAPPADIARYHGRYRAGWEAVRAERWRRVQELGVVHGTLSQVERAVGPPYHFPAALKRLGSDEVNRPLPWSSLTERQRVFQATKMEIHAAMVERMDREIGRVVDQLRAMNALENTLILFLSDNGASAEIMVRDDGHDPAAAPGSARSHLCLGPGWSTVANTPFRRHKTWVHEGGIATPLVVHWPRGIAARGELRTDPGHMIDIVPTIREVAGAPGRVIAVDGPTPPGKSLVGAFAHDGALAHDDLWWAHEGNRAIRVGNWKLVAAKDGPWELYDLAADRTETSDLAPTHAAEVAALSRRWQGHMDEFTEIARDNPKPPRLGVSPDGRPGG
jgi:arylsulfatase A-like enzyme